MDVFISESCFFGSLLKFFSIILIEPSIPISWPLSFSVSDNPKIKFVILIKGAICEMGIFLEYIESNSKIYFETFWSNFCSMRVKFTEAALPFTLLLTSRITQGQVQIYITSIVSGFPYFGNKNLFNQIIMETH